jgi:hypothetical protein
MNPFKHVLFATVPWNRLVLLALLCPFTAAAQEGPQSFEESADQALQQAPRDTQIRRAKLARWIDADADSPLAGIPTNDHLGTSRSRWK